MGRMIDTDAAYTVLTDYYHHTTGTQHQALKEALGRVETVEAVPVVRCKDCKHHHYQNGIPYCDRYYWGWKDDDFCSSGERKEGEAHGTDIR